MRKYAMRKPFFNKLPTNNADNNISNLIIKTTTQLFKATIVGATSIGFGTGAGIGFYAGKQSNSKNENKQTYTPSNTPCNK